MPGAKNKSVNWQVADITSLPFDESVFSGAVCTLAIHHFQDLLFAFREVRRVLTSGCFVIFTSTPEQMNNYWLVEYFPEAIRRSAEQMPSLKVVEAALRKAGFANVETEYYRIKKDLQDFFLYSGKYQPELYLDAQVRANISTFSLLAEQSEVKSGLEKLASDIREERIQRIIGNYMETSDYVFVKAIL